MTIITTSAVGGERKRLAGALGNLLGEKPLYLKAPTYAYQIGEYVVNRNSDVSCPDSGAEKLAQIMQTLTEEGFYPEFKEDEDAAEEAADAEAPANVSPEIVPESPETPSTLAVAEEPEEAAEKAADAPDVAEENPEAIQPADEAPVPENESDQMEESDPNRLTISIPRDKLTDDALARLRTIIANKEDLFKRALQTDDLPIEVSEDKVSFPWFTLTGVDGESTAYAQFITALCQMATEQTRVMDKPYDGDNDRFSMRIFMVRLGMKGAEFALARKLMMKHLTGNSGWRYGDSATKPENRDIPSRATIQHLKKAYPTGSRLTLIPMNDASDADIQIGAHGVVIGVDDNGSVFIKLDNGSAFGIAFSTDESAKDDADTAVPEDEPDDTADETIQKDEPDDTADDIPTEEADPDGNEPNEEEEADEE